MRTGRRRHLICTIACLALGAVNTAFALESDQFTLPPRPLHDLGDETSWLVWDYLSDIVERTNATIADDKYKAKISSTKTGTRYRERQIQKMSDGRYLAHELYSAIGRGFPEVRIEVLAQNLAEQYPQQPAIYHTGFGDSIYSGSAMARPLNVVGVVPTVKIDGCYMGTDKLGHFFQQGYEYYKEYIDEEDDGESEAACYKEAVELGESQEGGIYGVVPSGTYSNADLASNYAGLKFYLNLDRPVRIGNRIQPPLLMYSDEHGWQFNEQTYERWGRGLLKPFISDHFSEAANPAHFDWTMRSGIRDKIKDRGAAWVAFHHTNRPLQVKQLREMQTWFGEDYGHSGWEDVITIVSAYFDTLEDEPVIASKPAVAAPSLARREVADDDTGAALNTALDRKGVKNKSD